MATFFISYSRVDKAFVERFVARLRRKFPNHTFWFDEELTGGDDWWAEIIGAIEKSDIFIYLLSNESVTSLYCQAEFREAQRLQRRIISVQARDRTTITGDLSKIQYVDMKTGVDNVDAQDELTRAVNKQVGLIPARRLKPLWKPATPKPEMADDSGRSADAPEVDTPDLNIVAVEQRPTPKSLPKQTESSQRLWMSPVLIGMVLVLIVAVSVVFVLAQNRGNSPMPEPLSLIHI